MTENLKQLLKGFVAGAITIAVLYLGYTFYQEISAVNNHESRIQAIENFLNQQIKAAQSASQPSAVNATTVNKQ